MEEKKFVIENDVPDNIRESKSLFRAFEKGEQLCIQCPTWEAKDVQKMNSNSKNPGWFLYDLNIDGEERSIYVHSSYMKDFIADPHVALREIGAFPTASGSFFYAQRANIRKNINKNRIPPLDLKNQFVDSFIGDMDKEYVIHVDLGLKHDSTAICMAHADGKYERNGRFYPKVIIDLVYEMNPKDYGGEIYIHNVRKFICDLRDVYKFNIIHISFDSFQSADSQQLLSIEGFPTSTISVDRSPYPHQTLKEAINLTNFEEDMKILDYYYHEKLFYELENLIYGKNGVPNHSPSNSKDIADAVAGCIFSIYKLEEERLNNFIMFEIFDGF